MILRPMLSALLLTLLLPAQDPNLKLAQRLITALVPARDSADAQTRSLIEAALDGKNSPAAALLAAEVRSRAEEVTDAPLLRQQLAEGIARAKPVGLVAQRLAEFDFRLWRRTGGVAPADPFASYARSVTILGPFGSGDGPWLDEPFPPDNGFASGSNLRGRYGPVVLRTLTRGSERHTLSLLDPVRQQPGAHFVRWQIAVQVETTGFIEVEYAGSYRLLFDGYEQGRVDPQQQPGSAVKRFCVHLLSGEHAVVLRTGDKSQAALALRIVDALGSALPQVIEVTNATAQATKAAVDPLEPSTFADGLTSLEQSAKAQAGTDAALLRTAAAWAAQRLGETDRLLQLLSELQAEPPQSADAQLLLADILRHTDSYPEELRNSTARELEDAALKVLPEDHLRAMLVRVSQLEDQDHGEDALRMLRLSVDADRAGPMTFAAMVRVCLRLKFAAELQVLVPQWAKRCPQDPQAHLALAARAADLRCPQVALQHLQRALALKPADANLQRNVLQSALALGQHDLARTMIDRMLPEDLLDAQRSLFRAQLFAQLAANMGDQLASCQQLDAIAAHPLATPDDWRRLCDRWLALGFFGKALAAADQSLALSPGQADLLNLRDRLGGPKTLGADFARFRVDGDALIRAFKPGPLDAEAPTSLLIDQRIAELLPDGTVLTEIHELRRINDQTGVESIGNAEAAAGADELLLLRTIDQAGITYVPTRVQNGFSMPHLEPGAFVEWRYRTLSRSPGASPLQMDPFLLASDSESLHRTEYVLILPAKCRGELRLRNLATPPIEQPLDLDRRALVFRRDAVMRLPTEANTEPAEERVPLAEYGEDTPLWQNLRSLRAVLLSRSRPTPPITAFVRELLNGCASDTEKLRKLHQFCQAEIAEGNANQALEVLLTRKGNRFLLMLAMLRAAMLDVTPAACRPQRAELNSTAEPLFAKGDTASLPAIFVQPRDGKEVWLFADTPRYLPLGMIPAKRGGTEAFLLAKSGARSVSLPAATASMQDITFTGTATILNDVLVAKGRLQLGDVTGYGLADQIRRRNKDVRSTAARQLCQQMFEGWRVRTAQVAELDPPGRPLLLDCEVQNAGVQQDGTDRFLLPVPLPLSKARSSFGDRDQRTMPLRIAQDIDFRNRIVVEPSENLEFAEPPPPMLLSFGPLDYQLTFSLDGRTMIVDRRLRIRPTTLPSALYPEWLRLLSRIDAAEQQTLSLHKRAH
ncbi:MAG: hypothetical protein EXS02_03480 [Planctomycetes bacterium]|nr:hypothetical protein [Planctomycetota bacterium]